ncbi:hypothetical protein EON66_01775 [archaeon]|nr:MAG: hypothetical protein EON66_01775 [archaeon]
MHCRYDGTSRTLQELAAEPNCNWMTAAAMFDDSLVFGAEHHYNLFSAVRKTVGKGADMVSYLDIVGEYHVGDMINRYVPAPLSPHTHVRSNRDPGQCMRVACAHPARPRARVCLCVQFAAWLPCHAAHGGRAPIHKRGR